MGERRRVLSSSMDSNVTKRLSEPLKKSGSGVSLSMPEASMQKAADEA